VQSAMHPRLAKAKTTPTSERDAAVDHLLIHLHFLIPVPTTTTFITATLLFSGRTSPILGLLDKIILLLRYTFWHGIFFDMGFLCMHGV
jgi:hypothetical protein